MADGRLIFDTKIDNTGFQRGMGSLKSITKSSMSVVNTTMKVAAGVVGAIGLASIKTGVQFDTSISRVKALSGATDKEFQALRKTAMKLGKDTVFSASEAAEGMGYLAMAGYETNDIIAAMPGLLDMAAAGQTDLGTTADITSNILSGFDLQASKTGTVADVLTKTFTSSNTSLESLGETMKYVGPVAKSAGWSLEETATAAGILGDAGISGAQAGTSLRQMLLRLIDPPKEAADALNQLGITAVDNATGKIKPLEQIIREVDEATKDWDDAQRAAIVSQIAGTTSSSAMLALLDAGADKIADFQGELEKTAKSTKSFAKEIAEIQLDNLEGQIKLLGSALETLGILIYDELKKPLQDVARDAGVAVGRLVDAFTKSGFMGLADEVGYVLSDALQKAASFTPKMLEMGTRIILAFLKGIRSNMDNISSSMSTMLQSIITSFVEVYPAFIATGIELVAKILQGLVEGMPRIIGAIQTGATVLVNSIVQYLPLMLDSGIKIVASLVEGIASSLPELITAGINLIINLADTFIANIDVIIQAGLAIIVGLAKGIMDNLPKLIENVPRIINAFADAIYNNLPKILVAGVKIILELIKGLIKSIPTLVANIPQIIMAIVNAFTLYNWAQMGANLMKWVGNGIKSLAGNLGSIGKNVAQGVWNAVKGIFQGAPRLGSGFVRHIGSGIKSLFGFLKGIGTSLAKGAITAVRNAFKAAPSLGKAMVQGIWNGISDVTGWILNQIAGFGNAVMNKIKGIFGIKSPSRWMRDEIGKNLVLGIGVGLDMETPTIEKDLVDMSDKMKEAIDLENVEVGASVVPTGEYENLRIMNRQKYEDEKNNDDPVLITGNEFIIREEKDIEKTAKELKRLIDKDRRGRR